MERAFFCFQNFKRVRDHHTTKVEGFFCCWSVLACLLGWITLGIAGEFTGSPHLKEFRFEFEQARDALMVFATLMCFLLQFIAMCGCKVALDRTTPNCCIVIYGTVLFFFTAVPLLSEGAYLKQIGVVSDPKIDGYCNMTREELKEEATNSWVRSYFLMAKRFDTISEEISADHMCTQFCPCLEYEFRRDHQMRGNTKVQYDMILEKWLNRYGRTNFNQSWATKHGQKPMIWTKDPQFGFTSWAKCREHWTQKALQKPSLANFKVFAPSLTLNGTIDPLYKKADWAADKGDAPNRYLYNHKTQMMIYQKLEDQYNCSGMCTPGLFYHHNPLSYGPPTETCLKKVIHHIKEDSGPMADVAIVSGTFCLLMFLSHFCLYQRPIPQSKDDPEYESQLVVKLFKKQFTQLKEERPAQGVQMSNFPGANAHRVPDSSVEASIEQQPGNQIDVRDVRLDVRP